MNTGVVEAGWASENTLNKKTIFTNYFLCVCVFMMGYTLGPIL